MSKVEIYQIAYDEPSKGRVLNDGFRLLDNLSNDRPDWFEYWPIRRYLNSNPLQDDTLYGFFSPRFQEKTGLNASGVQEVISELENRDKDLDVILFSPQPDMGAFFLNVFEQGEMFHPGHMAVARSTLMEIGFDVPLEGVVMDSRQIVYSNYFVAKPRFWRVWFEVTEAIFRMAEDPLHKQHGELNTGTSYREGAQQKVFLIERIASLLLTTQTQWRVASADTFKFAWSSFSSFNGKPELAYQSDALKLAFRQTHNMCYMKEYESIRKSIGCM
jgi:hypothetical protein